MKKTAIFVLLMIIAILLLVIAFNIGRGVRMAGLNQGQSEGQQHIQLINAAVEKNGLNIESQFSNAVLKVYLGKRGVSEDLATWYGEDQFAEFIKACQDKGFKEIQYKLIPDSIERIEKRWSDELKNAGMKSYVEAD